jgi:hypothetical protein
MQDIRELLEIGKGQAPPPRYGIDDIVTAGRRRRRLVVAERIGGAGVLAAGLVAIGVFVGNVGPSGNPPVTHPKVAQPAAPSVVVAPLTFTFGPYSAAGYRVLPPQEVTRTYETANIVRDYEDANGKKNVAFAGTLTVYRPGVRPPAIFTSGTKVTVQDMPGFANERAQDTLLMSNGDGVDRNPVSAMANTLAWQYSADGWVVINSLIEYSSDLPYRLTAANERALADGFRLGIPSPARIPFQAGYLPAGWRVVSVSGRSFSAEDIAQISVVFAPASAAGATEIRHFTGTDGPAVTIDVIHDQIPPPPDAPKTKTTCNADRYCSWDIPHTQYAAIVHDPSNMLSTAELTKIGQSLTFDNLQQPNTWHVVS